MKKRADIRKYIVKTIDIHWKSKRYTPICCVREERKLTCRFCVWYTLCIQKNARGKGCDIQLKRLKKVHKNRPKAWTNFG